jgi:hypothetical protein
MGYVKNSLNQDFSNLMALVCEGSQLFRDYDRTKVLVSCSRSKNQGKTGVWAFVAPLCFENGKTVISGRYKRRSGHWVLATDSKGALSHHQRFPEARYIMNFLVPRFFYLTPQERLETLVHEIYHLEPELKGGLRTFPPPFKHHGPTPHAYRKRVQTLTENVKIQFPELLEHPLLKNGPENFLNPVFETFSVPKKIFKPHAFMGLELPGMFMLRNLLLFLFLFFGFTQKALAIKEPEKYYALKKGNLFDKPARFATKLGTVEVNDEFEKLSSSATGSWTQVRLLLTGEEGWYPTSWIRIEKLKLPNVTSPYSVELGLGWATGGGAFNFTLGAFKNILSRSDGLDNREFSNWNRFEVGPEFMFFLGENFVSESSLINLSTTWWNAGVSGHYYFQAIESVSSLEFLTSLFVFNRTISGQGISKDILISEGLDPYVFGVGLSLGVGFHFQLSRLLDLGVRARYINQKGAFWNTEVILGAQF